MGAEVEEQRFTGADVARHRERLRAGLEALTRMIQDDALEPDRPMAGLELELNLVDAEGRPASVGGEVLETADHPDLQSELGRFNLEVNAAPARLDDGALSGFEEQLRALLEVAGSAAAAHDAEVVTIGILPTLEREHLHEEHLTPEPRYRMLSDRILAARGEDVHLDLRGVEQLELTTDTILPEAACTSAQVHLQTSVRRFAAHWNAAQAIAGVQVALGANSPYLLGRELWRETRLPLFEQATDTRSEELRAQGVRPRVWFGERWIDSVVDLFEENVRWFPPLLPVTEDEEPHVVLDAGGTPDLAELRLHNGTVYRWNRPVYDVVDDTAHLRVENRLLPAGPTLLDTVANAALWFGLVRALSDADEPVWERLDFADAEANLVRAAREGIEARLVWPEVGESDVRTLVLERLLPLAHAGLESWGVGATERSRYLGVIEGRCRTGVNGAAWSVRRTRALEQAGHDRREALRRMMLEYRDHARGGEPVHTWPSD